MSMRLRKGPNTILTILLRTYVGHDCHCPYAGWFWVTSIKFPSFYHLGNSITSTTVFKDGQLETKNNLTNTSIR